MSPVLFLIGMAIFFGGGLVLLVASTRDLPSRHAAFKTAWALAIVGVAFMAAAVLFVKDLG